MVTSFWRRASIAAFFLLLGALWLSSPAAADADAPFDLTCADGTLVNEDDAWAEVTLPFSVDMGNENLDDTIYVSENGYLGFTYIPGDWSPISDLGQLADYDDAVIAPLYADASQGSGSVSYGTTTFGGRDAFCVNWTDLEPNLADSDVIPDPVPTNSFQVVLVERSDRSVGAFDVITNYETVGWDDSYCNNAGELRFGDCCEDVIFNPEIEPIFEGPVCCDPGFDGPCCDLQFDGPCCDLQFDGPCCDVEFQECCDVEFQECCDIGDGIIIPCEQIPSVQAQAVFPAGESTPGYAGVSIPDNNFNGFNDALRVSFPGSGVIDGMIDPDGLSSKSLNSDQAGRFLVEVGRDVATGFVVGTVERADDGTPVADAPVWICTDPDALIEEEEEFIDIDCAYSRTDENGDYRIDGVPLGFYEVTARGPARSDLYDATVEVEVISEVDPTGVPTIELFGPTPPPANVGFGPTNSWGSGTTVYYRDDLDVSITGCVDGTATWAVSTTSGPLNGTMTEGPPGTYSGVIPQLFPAHGNATVTIDLSCPDPSEDQEPSFPIYIDPSGTVLEVHSREPIEGVEVILERRDSELFPFEQVPDGDDIMSPTNRQNPFETEADGAFGWDVIAGQYRVTVSKDGCDTIALPAEWADRILKNVDGIVGVPDASVTPVLQVLPEWLGLELFLDCNNPPTIEDPGPLTLSAPAFGADLPTPLFSDPDPDDIEDLTLENNAPLQFPIGDTTVTWTVTDSSETSTSVTQIVTVIAPADDDDADGVSNEADDCPGTMLPDIDPTLAGPDRFVATIDGFVDANGDVELTLADTRGCSGLQILDLVVVSPDFNEATEGLRLSTIQTWIFECSADAGVLTWTDVAGDGSPIKYWIYESTDNGESFVFLDAESDGTTYTVPVAEVGAEYQVHYQGIGRVNCDIVSEPVEFSCASDRGVLNWRDDAQSKYWAYRSLDAGETYEFIGRTLGATTFTDVNPVPGALYQVHYAGLPRTDCLIVNEPAVPPPFACSVDSGVITWTDVGVAPYWVYRSIDGGQSYQWIGRSLSALTFTDVDTEPGALYQVHHAGISRTDCGIAGDPADGMAFRCFVTQGGQLSWSDEQANPYWVYKSVDGGETYTWIGRTLGATSFADPAPTEGDLYQVHFAGIPRTDCMPEEV